MNRQGAALAAALLVVLLGGVLVATSVTWAVAELRAGSSWSARARSEAASSGLIDMLPDFQAWLDSSAVGDTLTALHDSGGSVVSARAVVLSDSLLLLHTVSNYREGEARVGLILRLSPDSTGLRPFGVAPRYHPLP